MDLDRLWMYRRLDTNKCVTDEYFQGVSDFISTAKIHARLKYETDLIVCPCSKCRNVYPHLPDKLYTHLVKNGFVQHYLCWEHHGEDAGEISLNNSAGPSSPIIEDEYRTMVGDGMGFTENVQDYVGTTNVNMSEEPNKNAAAYYKLLQAADEPIYEGCASMSNLSLVSQLLNLKSESRISIRHHEHYVSIMKQLPPNQVKNIPATYYQAKKLLLPLRLPDQKIDVCVDNCMLFFGDDARWKNFTKCNKPRYKIDSKSSKGKLVPHKVLTYFPLGPRLQRLYMSGKTAESMTWNHYNRATDGFMSHPSHGGAWKHFNDLYPDFASEPHNVRIGLCTYGFNPFGQFGRNYSCWPVMICVYNLPPGLCMKDPYIFLSLIVPGPKNPSRDLDVFLRPLIDELKQLWEYGIVTFDAARQQNFTMRVTLMWTISDFPAYGMLCGWSTHGKLACPYCMAETDSHYLSNGRKVSWFDCHRKFLPRDHPDRRNRVVFLKRRVVTDDVLCERLTGDELIHSLNNAQPQNIFGVSNRKLKSHGYGIEHHWTKTSIFWELPY